MHDMDRGGEGTRGDRTVDRLGTPLGTEVVRAFGAVLSLLAAGLLVHIVGAFLVVAPMQRTLAVHIDALRQATSAHEAMLDEETGLRGYILTGDAAFLAPYRTGQSQLRSADAALFDGVHGDPELARLTLDLRLREQAWTTGWAEPRAAAPAADGRSAAELERGKQLFDSYRNANNALMKRLAAGLQTTQRGMDAATSLLSRLQLGLLLLAFGVAVVSVVRLRRQIRRPVGELVGALERISAGDLSPVPPVRGPAELTRLGEGLRHTVEQLRVARDELGLRREEALAHSTSMALVLEFARAIGGSLSVRYVVQALAESAQRISGGDVVVWLVGEDHDLLELVHPATGSSRHGLTVRSLPLGEGVAGEAARFGRAVVRVVVQADQSGAAGTVLALPMIVGARVVGVLDVHVTGEPAAQVQSVLEALAVHAATALEAARLYERAEEWSRLDALTRLHNRRRFDEDLARETRHAQRHGLPLALVMCDVDHFKRFNDTHGHAHGDEVLQRFAALLEAGLRAGDRAYRYGGEEFALLLRDTDATGAVALAERIRATVADALLPGGAEPVTASFGVASAPHDGYQGDDLLLAADAALYAAKRAGRDRVVAPGLKDALALPL
jgi:diguanylate cyclase (GGDEF)-like protein